MFQLETVGQLTGHGNVPQPPAGVALNVHVHAIVGILSGLCQSHADLVDLERPLAAVFQRHLFDFCRHLRFQRRQAAVLLRVDVLHAGNVRSVTAGGLFQCGQPCVLLAVQCLDAGNVGVVAVAGRFQHTQTTTEPEQHNVDDVRRHVGIRDTNLHTVELILFQQCTLLDNLAVLILNMVAPKGSLKHQHFLLSLLAQKVFSSSAFASASRSTSGSTSISGNVNRSRPALMLSRDRLTLWLPASTPLLS